LPKSIAPEACVRTVLVVEDEATDQAVLVSLLSEAGYAVRAVSTGTEALVRCQEQTFDVITLALLLPDMSGLDLLASFRASGRNRHTPVVVVSTVADPTTVAAYPVHAVLAKPIDPTALLDSLLRASVDPQRSNTVVVVEEDPSSLRLMEAALELLGYRAACRSDGESALAAIRQLRPIAVVFGLLMPTMDVFEFLARLRQHPDERVIPVFIWTDKDLTHAEATRLQASTQGFISKGSPGASSLLDELKAMLPPLPSTFVPAARQGAHALSTR
jgi:CheY-like chemotaxis protein